MEEKKQELKPSYASSGQADAILDLFRRLTPKKIDSKFVSDNGIATPTNAFRVVDFVRWMGITNTVGNVKEEVATNLKLMGPDRDKYIVELIKKSYDEIFKRCNLQEATKHDIINFFVTQYKFGGPQSIAAARLFLHLCQKYGITISDELKKKSYTKTPQPRRKKEKKLIKSPKEKGIDRENLTGNFISGGILIKCRISTVLEPKTKEEADDILENKLPDLFNALKLFLPDKKNEEKKLEELND